MLKQIFTAIALLAATSPALAGKISVRPLGAVLAPNETVTSFTITNLDTKPVRLQMQGFAWVKDPVCKQVEVEQTNDKDGEHPSKLENVCTDTPETSDIKFGPSLVEIQPGKEQVVRLGRVVPFAGPEMHYRAQITEIPADLKDEPQEQGAKIILPIAYNVGVFWREPTASANVAASWVSNGLELRNNGTATAKVLAPNDKGAMGLLGYVLPGQTKVFPYTKSQGSLTLNINGQLQQF